MSKLNCIAEKIIEVMIEKNESKSNIFETREYLKDLSDLESIHEKILLDRDGEIKLCEKLFITHDELWSMRNIMGKIFWMLNCEKEGNYYEG